MKKTCDKCRAFDSGCTLGYETSLPRSYTSNDPYLYSPLEKCPKPKTYKQLFKQINENKQSLGNA